MANASDALASIQKEIERLIKESNELKAKINKNEMDPAFSAQVERWCKERMNYEDKLQEVRAKEEQALGFQAQGEAYSLIALKSPSNT